jgi:hypothetical protein
MYTNLKTDAHKYNTKHTLTPLSHTTKHGALIARLRETGESSIEIEIDYNNTRINRLMSLGPRCTSQVGDSRYMG